MTSRQEYFAECSEAFWSSGRFRNDFYPFVYDELKSFDPEGHELVKIVFGCGDRDEKEGSLTPEDYSPDHYPVNIMGRKLNLRDFLMNNPLTVVLLISASKFYLVLFNRLLSDHFYAAQENECPPLLKFSLLLFPQLLKYMMFN